MKTQIHLPKPCHENWNRMTPQQQGRFCQSCQKTVYDFTKSSDRQIIAHLQNNSNTCGRFLSSQLDRDLVIPQQKTTFWTATFAGFISLFVLGNDHAWGQTKQQSVNTYRAKYNREPLLQKKGEVMQIKTDSTIRINGIVMEGGLPVSAANVIIKGKGKNTHTDFDGNFSIDAQPGDTLAVFFIGYKDYELVLAKTEDNLVIELEPLSLALGGMVMVGGITSRKVSFVQRQLNHIRNWFR